jgi:WhiB family redox-sensing transcriptional regulator
VTLVSSAVVNRSTGTILAAEPRNTVSELLDRIAAGRPAWMADAACKEHPEVSFFPDRYQPAGPALAVCAACLVRDECRAYALDQEVALAGVWGGTTSLGRRKLRAFSR